MASELLEDFFWGLTAEVSLREGSPEWLRTVPAVGAKMDPRSALSIVSCWSACEQLTETEFEREIKKPRVERGHSYLVISPAFCPGVIALGLRK